MKISSKMSYTLLKFKEGKGQIIRGLRIVAQTVTRGHGKDPLGPATTTTNTKTNSLTKLENPKNWNQCSGGR